VSGQRFVKDRQASRVGPGKAFVVWLHDLSESLRLLPSLCWNPRPSLRMGEAFCKSPRGLFPFSLQMLRRRREDAVLPCTGQTPDLCFGTISAPSSHGREKGGSER
jgi:hypothetical protein